MSQKPTNERVGTENEFAKVWVEGGCMVCVFKPEKVDLDIAKKCFETRNAVANGVIFPVCIDTRSVKSITKDAREFFAAEENLVNIKAGALLVSSAVNSFMGNFFLSINKPPRPTRLFTSLEEAFKWLNQYKD